MSIDPQHPAWQQASPTAKAELLEFLAHSPDMSSEGQSVAVTPPQKALPKIPAALRAKTTIPALPLTPPEGASVPAVPAPKVAPAPKPKPKAEQVIRAARPQPRETISAAPPPEIRTPDAGEQVDFALNPILNQLGAAAMGDPGIPVEGDIYGNMQKIEQSKSLLALPSAVLSAFANVGLGPAHAGAGALLAGGLDVSKAIRAGNIERTLAGKAVEAAAVSDAEKAAMMRNVAGDLGDVPLPRTPAAAPPPPRPPKPPVKTAAPKDKGLIPDATVPDPNPTRPAPPPEPALSEAIVEPATGAPPPPSPPPRHTGGGGPPDDMTPPDRLPSDPEIAKNIDPNDYQLMKKFKDLPQDQYDNFSRILKDWAAEPGNMDKRHVNHAKLEADVADIDPELVAQLKPPGEYESWTIRDYEKARRVMLSANEGADRLRTLASQAVDDAERAALTKQAESLENVSKAMLDGMVPTRSQKGLDLLYFKSMAKNTLDPTIMISRAQKIKNAPLTQPEQAAIVADLTRGQRAQRNLDELEAAKTSGDPDKIDEVAGRIIKDAEDAQAVPTDARKLYGELDAAKKDLAKIEPRRKELIRQINEGPDAPPGSPSVAGMQAELQSLNGEEAALRVKSEKLSREYSTILARVRRKEGAVPGRQAKIDNLNEVNDDYDRILSIAQEELTRLAKYKNSIKAKIVTRNKGIAAKTEGMPDLESDLLDLQARTDEIKAHLKDMSAAKSALNTANKRGQKRLVIGEEKVAGYEKEWSDLQGKLDEMTTTLGTAADNVRAARKLRNSLKGKIGRSVDRLEQLNLANEIAKDGLLQARRRVADKLNELHRTGPVETLMAATKAGLLLGVKTVARNVLGSGLFQATEELAKVPAAFIDLALTPISEPGLTVARTFDPRVRENALGAAIRSVQMAGTKGVKEAGEIWRKGMTDDQRMNMEVHREIKNYAPSVQALFRGKIEMVPSATVNGFVNQVFRFQGAQDRIMWVNATHRSLEERAGHIADQMVRDGQLAKADRDNMQEAMVRRAWGGQEEALMAEAAADGQFATFNNDNWISKGMAGFEANAMKWVSEHGNPGEVALAHAAKLGKDATIRFLKTPTNIAGKIWDYSPIGAAVNAGSVALSRPQKALVALVKGDPALTELMRKLNPKERRFVAMSIGRGAIGTGVMALGWFAARDGNMTGYYSQDEGTRGTDELLGRQPGAVKAGGQYRKVSGFAPITNLPIVGASLYYSANRGLPAEQVPGALIGTIGRTVLDQPMAQGANQALDALNDPAGKRGMKYMQGLAGQVIPTIASDVGAIGDPYQRKPADIGQAIQARTPGHPALGPLLPGGRSLLPIRTDVFGNPLENTPWNAVDPTTPTKNKALDNDVLKVLEELGPELRISPPDDRIPVRGKKEKYQMTPDEYNIYKKRAGDLAQQKIRKWVLAPEYRKDFKALPLDDFVDDEGNAKSGKLHLIRTFIEDSRAEARAQLFTPKPPPKHPQPAGAVK